MFKTTLFCVASLLAAIGWGALSETALRASAETLAESHETAQMQGRSGRRL